MALRKSPRPLRLHCCSNDPRRCRTQSVAGGFVDQSQRNLMAALWINSTRSLHLSTVSTWLSLTPHRNRKTYNHECYTSSRRRCHKSPTEESKDDNTLRFRTLSLGDVTDKDDTPLRHDQVENNVGNTTSKYNMDSTKAQPLSSALPPRHDTDTKGNKHKLKLPERPPPYAGETSEKVNTPTQSKVIGAAQTTQSPDMSWIKELPFGAVVTAPSSISMPFGQLRHIDILDDGQTLVFADRDNHCIFQYNLFTGQSSPLVGDPRQSEPSFKPGLSFEEASRVVRKEALQFGKTVKDSPFNVGAAARAMRLAQVKELEHEAERDISNRDMIMGHVQTTASLDAEKVATAARKKIKNETAKEEKNLKLSGRTPLTKIRKSRFSFLEKRKRANRVRRGLPPDIITIEGDKELKKAVKYHGDKCARLVAPWGVRVLKNKRGLVFTDWLADVVGHLDVTTGRVRQLVLSAEKSTDSTNSETLKIHGPIGIREDPTDPTTLFVSGNGNFYKLIVPALESVETLSNISEDQDALEVADIELLLGAGKKPNLWNNFFGTSRTITIPPSPDDPSSSSVKVKSIDDFVVLQTTMGKEIVFSDSVGSRLFKIYLNEKDKTTGQCRCVVHSGGGENTANDGSRLDSGFDSPGALEVTPDGQTIFVADTMSHMLRAVDAITGEAVTIAGTGDGQTIDGYAGRGKLLLPGGVRWLEDLGLLVFTEGKNRMEDGNGGVLRVVRLPNLVDADPDFGKEFVEDARAPRNDIGRPQGKGMYETKTIPSELTEPTA